MTEYIKGKIPYFQELDWGRRNLPQIKKKSNDISTINHCVASLSVLKLFSGWTWSTHGWVQGKGNFMKYQNKGDSLRIRGWGKASSNTQTHATRSISVWICSMQWAVLGSPIESGIKERIFWKISYLEMKALNSANEEFTSNFRTSLEVTKARIRENIASKIVEWIRNLGNWWQSISFFFFWHACY